MRVISPLLFALVWLGAGCQTVHAKRTSQAPHPLPVVHGDVTLETEVQGDPKGEVLLVIQGGPGLSRDYLASLLPLIPERFTVVTWNPRGVKGSSTPTTSGWSPHVHEQDLEAVRVALGAKKVHLLGHSFGALWVGGYAARHPERVASLVLMDGIPPTSAGLNEGLMRYGARYQALRKNGTLPADLPPSQGADCSDSVHAQWPLYSANGSHQTPKELAATHCTVPTYQAVLAGSKDYDFAGPLSRLEHVPALVLFGAADPFGLEWRDETVAALAADHPTVVTIPNAGHFPWIEAPEKVRAALADFYGQVH